MEYMTIPGDLLHLIILIVHYELRPQSIHHLGIV